RSFGNSRKREQHACHEHAGAEESWQQMSDVGIANGEVNADRRSETGDARDCDRLPQATRERAAPEAEKHREAAATDAAAEAGSGVSDERYEAGVRRFKSPLADLHELQVLWDEHRRHSDA